MLGREEGKAKTRNVLKSLFGRYFSSLDLLLLSHIANMLGDFISPFAKKNTFLPGHPLFTLSLLLPLIATLVKRGKERGARVEKKRRRMGWEGDNKDGLWGPFVS